MKSTEQDSFEGRKGTVLGLVQRDAEGREFRPVLLTERKMAKNVRRGEVLYMGLGRQMLVQGIWKDFKHTGMWVFVGPAPAYESTSADSGECLVTIVKGVK